jgi:uncharacterized protein YndB with AHSA1/START domain
MDIYERQKNPRENHSVLLDVYIRTQAADLFGAISNPYELENWWPNTCEGEARMFGKYRFYFSEVYDWHAEVIDIVRDRVFALRMTHADADWLGTELRFTLEEQGEQTLLHFEHTGWPYDNPHYRHSAFCWALLLNGLKNYLEKGDIIRFEERA